MPDILLLPAPKPIKSVWRQNGAVSLAFIGIMAASIFFAHSLVPQKEILANIALKSQELSFQNDSSFEELIHQKNQTLVRLMVDGKDYQMVTLKDIGFEYTLSGKTPSFLLKSSSAQTNEPTLQLTMDYKVWNSSFDNIRQDFEKASIKPEISWDESKGWHLISAEAGLSIRSESIQKGLQALVNDLELGTSPAVLEFKTSPEKELISAHERRVLNQMNTALQKLVREPLVFQLGDETTELDLHREKDFIAFENEQAVIQQEKLREWIQDYVLQHTRAPEKVRIVGKEEIRSGVSRAVVEGTFREGLRINADELFAQALDALNSENRTIVVKSYEVPVKVFSALEDTDYQLLSVGYSEYSSGNAPNRVHNVQTGLDRINGLLVDPGQEISFNKSVGSINNDFRMGYGIYGSVALPVLGGGICQVSTTFYRALLNLGVPITMRQNHSWDLSYYQAGGYGLDATIFPEKGLDVKAINDVPSQLFFYSYTRPESQEAFVLIYGKGDGRKITLTPEKEYTPFKGAKTLKWKHSVELPTGEIREHEIVSRYRS